VTSAVKDDGRFPLYLKILWGVLVLTSTILVYLQVAPTASWDEGYARIGLFIILPVVCVSVFVFASFGTFLWHEVYRMEWRACPFTLEIRAAKKAKGRRHYDFGLPFFLGAGAEVLWRRYSRYCLHKKADAGVP